MITVLLAAGAFCQILTPAHDSSVGRSGSALDLDRVAVKVNGVSLKESDVQRVMQQLFPYYAVHGGKVPAEHRPEIRQKALKQLILEELVYQEARRRGITVPQEQIRDAVRKGGRDFRSTAEYNLWILRNYGSEKGFEHKIERAKIVAKLWDLEVTRKSSVTEGELRSYYRRNAQRFVRPASVALQTISFLVNKGSKEERRSPARKRAEEVLPKARAAKNYAEFGLLAEKYSEDDWRVMMGDHKLVHRGSLSPQLEQRAFQMKKGSTSELVAVPEGFIILRVYDKTPATQMPLSKVQVKLREEMQRERTANRVNNFEQSLRAKAKIEQLDPDAVPAPQVNKR